MAKTIKSLQQIWVNDETGERIEGQRELKDVTDRRGGFSIVYNQMDSVYNTIMSRKDTRVSNFIIHHVDIHNKLIITTEELANILNVSQAHVIAILKILREADLIKTKTGSIMINPKWRNKVRKCFETALCKQYMSFNNK